MYSFEANSTRFGIKGKSHTDVINSAQGLQRFLNNSAVTSRVGLSHISRSQQQPIIPELPPHLDKSIDKDWSLEASREIDRFLWYLELEFELIGGAV